MAAGDVLVDYPAVMARTARQGGSWQECKNGQDVRETAFLAVQQIAPRGFEPLEGNQQDIENKALTEDTNPVLATGLDKTLQKYPELARLIEAWPDLPEHTKAAIKALVQTHIKVKRR